MLHLKTLAFSYNTPQQFFYDRIFSRGESIALMGKSGSGKTTLFQLIAGFLSPHSGEVCYEGQSWAGVKTRDRPVSYLRQNALPLGHLSVHKNMILSRAPPSHIKNIAHQLGLDTLMDQKAEELSGGQIQRVLLAQTLLQKRPIVLLDEPFKGLDSENKQRCLEVIRESIDPEKQLLMMITHDEKDVTFLKSQKILI